LPTFLLIALCILVAWQFLLSIYGVECVSEQNGKEVVRVAQNFIEGSGFERAYYRELDELFLEKSLKEKSSIWQDLYVMTEDGRLLSKFSPLLILLTALALILFGNMGPCILAFFMLFGLFMGMYLLLKQFLGRAPSLFSCLVIIFGSPLIFYSSSLSYDVLAGFLIVYGCFFLTKKPMLSGVLFGLTAFVRPSLILIGPCFYLFGAKKLNRSSFLLAYIGSVGVFFIYNAILWGSFLTSSHARMPEYTNGVRSLNIYPTTLRLEVFFADWLEKLFALPYGLLLLALPTLYVFAISLVWKNSEYQATMKGILAAVCVQAVITYSFIGWRHSFYGSRYLLFAYALLTVLSLFVWESQKSTRKK
jgi:hypothetical protein